MSSFDLLIVKKRIVHIRLLLRARVYSFCWKVENFVIQYRLSVFSLFFRIFFLH